MSSFSGEIDFHPSKETHFCPVVYPFLLSLRISWDPPVQSVQFDTIVQPPVQTIHSVQSDDLTVHPPVQTVQFDTTTHLPVHTVPSDDLTVQPPVQTVHSVQDATPDSPSDPEPPRPFYMPGNDPSQLTPYIPIWEKATTPPFPTKKPQEIDERFPSVRIDPPDTPYTDGYDLYIDPRLW